MLRSGTYWSVLELRCMWATHVNKEHLEINCVALALGKPTEKIGTCIRTIEEVLHPLPLAETSKRSP